jgi:serine/threonine protein phosphatase PrpC
MKILSSVYWRAGQPPLVNSDSLLLIEAASRKGPLLLALVCDGASATATGYMVEELRDWHNRCHLPIILGGKPLRWIKKSLAATLARLAGELAAQGERADGYSLLVLWAGRYLLMQSGTARAYLCQGQAARPCAGICRGRWRRGAVFLLCGAGFTERLSERQLSGALQARDLPNEAQMTKRLRALGAYVRQKGGRGDMAAICIKNS